MRVNEVDQTLRLWDFDQLPMTRKIDRKPVEKRWKMAPWRASKDLLDGATVTSPWENHRSHGPWDPAAATHAWGLEGLAEPSGWAEGIFGEFFRRNRKMAKQSQQAEKNWWAWFKWGIIHVISLGIFDHDRTLFSRALEIMVYVREIIPFYGPTKFRWVKYYFIYPDSCHIWKSWKVHLGGPFRMCYSSANFGEVASGGSWLEVAAGRKKSPLGFPQLCNLEVDLKNPLDTDWLVVWNMNFMTSISYRCHLSHWLSLHHFSRWAHCTTNQHRYWKYLENSEDRPIGTIYVINNMLRNIIFGGSASQNFRKQLLWNV